MSATAVPFVVLGDKHRATLRLLVAQCVGTWWSSWKAAPDAIDVQVRDDSAASDAKPARTNSDCVLARNAAGGSLLAVRASPDLMVALSGAMAGAAMFGAAAGSSTTSDELLSELRIEVLKSLCSAVLTRAKASDAAIEVLAAGEKFPPDAHTSRHVTVDVSLGSARAAVTLMLTPALIELLALRTPVTMPQEKLSRRRAAIREEHTRVEAVLGSVEVTLLDLAKLAEGDVIVLDQPLGQAGYLTTPAGAHITKIVLGRNGAERAVSMAS